MHGHSRSKVEALSAVFGIHGFLEQMVVPVSLGSNVTLVRRLPGWRGETERVVLKRRSSSSSNSTRAVGGVGSPDIAGESLPRNGPGQG